LLGSLVDKSLVLAEPAGPALRYRQLETIRQFAADRLAEAGGSEVSTVQAAHGRHFLSVAEAAAPHLTGPGQGGWLNRLDAERANLRQAVRHAAADPRGAEAVERFAVALQRYWISRVPQEEAFALLRPVLDRPEARHDPALFTAALIVAAGAACSADMATARQLAEHAHALARQLGAERLLIESLIVRSEIHFWAGEPERALPLAREAAEYARGLGDDVLLGMSLMTYLLYPHLIGSADRTSLFAEAIACTQRSGDCLVAGLLLNNASDHALLAGDIPAARAYLRQARAIQEAGDEQAYLAVNMGWLLRHDDDTRGALSSFHAALRIGRRRGDQAELAAAVLGLACLTADAGDWRRAARLHGVAQTFQERTRVPWQDLNARYRQHSLTCVQAHLNPGQFERSHTEGMALSSGQALDLASGVAI
jgi:tetratricopeptide (TPR) repeat protein